MKKVWILDLASLRKAVSIAIISIIFFSLSSCATFINALLDDTECAHPGCSRNASGKTAYCHFHVPPTLNENGPIKIDNKNAYKLHKPSAHTDIKIKRKNY